MSMISEQVKELRELAEDCKCENDEDDIVRALQVAADTIEELSAKLVAANMERSSAYYGGEWIPCSERLPEKENELLITSHEDGSVQIHAYRKEDGFILNWDVTKPKSEVVAWQQLPEPFKC